MSKHTREIKAEEAAKIATEMMTEFQPLLDKYKNRLEDEADCCDHIAVYTQCIVVGRIVGAGFEMLQEAENKGEHDDLCYGIIKFMLEEVLGGKLVIASPDKGVEKVH